MIHGRFSLHSHGHAWRLTDSQNGFVFGDFANPDQATAFADVVVGASPEEYEVLQRSHTSQDESIDGLAVLDTPMERTEALTVVVGIISALRRLTIAIEDGEGIEPAGRSARRVLAALGDHSR